MYRTGSRSSPDEIKSVSLTWYINKQVKSSQVLENLDQTFHVAEQPPESVRTHQTKPLTLNEN